MLLPAPSDLIFVGSNNGFVAAGSPIEFTFTDDPQWTTAVNSIAYTINGSPGPVGDLIGFFTKTPGNLKSNSVLGQSSDTGYIFVFTIKATGYADKVVTVTTQ